MTDIAVQEQAEDLFSALGEQLGPAEEELTAAARWALTHDASDGFRGELALVLAHLGVQGVDLGA